MPDFLGEIAKILQSQGGKPDPYPEYQPIPPEKNYGKRADGTQKGSGWLGARRRPDGGVSTEIGVGVNIGGKEMQIPLMVPGLTHDELHYLMTTPMDQVNQHMPDGLLRKAVEHAISRTKQGLSPFAP